MGVSSKSSNPPIFKKVPRAHTRARARECIDMCQLNLKEIKKMLESEIEKYLVKKIKNLGGVSYKFVSPGHAGVPDRICVLNNRVLFFVELKAPGKMTRPLQDMQIAKLRKYGQRVYVADSKDKIDEIIKTEARNGV